jgi:signal transduction histidine kinase
VEVQDRNGHWYRLHIRRYDSMDHKIEGAAFSLVDIEALKHYVGEAERARAQAERADRMKDEFLATVSHELRTPLAAMQIYAKRLCKEGDPKIRSAGEALERATRMQARLIDDLLDVSHIVAGKLRITLEPVDLGTVIRAAIEAVNVLVEKGAIELEVHLDESVGKISADPARLEQVVVNLLTNAIKFTPRGGRVTVDLGSADGWACLSVTDTGIGIDPGFLPHVFNRFSQEGGASSGLGLGLTIARHLVEAHGGTVAADSHGRDKGTKVSVMLPLVGDYSEQFDEAVQPVSTRVSSGRLRSV